MIKLEQLQLQYLVNEKGEKTAVVLPLQEFEDLLEALEDLAIIAQRNQESTISHEQFIEQLKQDGIL
ncbi:hypothetical protein PN437_19030 [Microcystis aeruginosa CS-564/01]|jgi:PHD/YefM family antitoxin component YafN of YafNO toxin-antitoxin module|uniref:hypothetical protein n=1 Tax=Microcystis aeruginosa TaxID=1126 RepID=UPI002330781C|nr:hypothetical protein [Microcystis aeruginosa]MDB9426959.1 hypothetical protein [Microcystis aeruginosa CS-564/01]